MEQYDVTGMTCAACSARVEKAVSSLGDVASCSVNLLTNSMIVVGKATPQEVISAVEKAGYGASVKGSRKDISENNSDPLKDKETPKMLRRLIASVVLLVPLMYVSMGHTMWNWPLPGFLNGNAMGIALFELLFTIAVMIINSRFFVSGFKGLVHRAPNMDTLVALGSGAAFVYSTVVMFIMSYELSAEN